MNNVTFELGELIYENSLASETDIKGFKMEGGGAVSFPMGRMRLEATGDVKEGQKSNIVFWCPQHLPDNISIRWDYYPVREPGLSILFFATKGLNGEDVLDPSLAPRSGPYGQYHNGDINALHVSYFRRKHPSERAFQTCNLRKSKGFHLVAQGADPIASVIDAQPPYHIQLIKAGPHVVFRIAHEEEIVESFRWYDDGETYGPILTDGKIGFRQMVPLIAEYANLKVHRVTVKD